MLTKQKPAVDRTLLDTDHHSGDQLTLQSTIPFDQAALDIEEIHHLHGEVLAAARRSLESIIRIGGLLAKLKEGCGHGNWCKFIEENLELSKRSVQNYLAIYKGRDSLKSAESADLPMCKALLRIPKATGNRRKGTPAPPPQPAEPPPAHHDSACAPASISHDQQHERDGSSMESSDDEDEDEGASALSLEDSPPLGGSGVNEPLPPANPLPEAGVAETSKGPPAVPDGPGRKMQAVWPKGWITADAIRHKFFTVGDRKRNAVSRVMSNEDIRQLKDDIVAFAWMVNDLGRERWDRTRLRNLEYAMFEVVSLFSLDKSELKRP